MIRRPPRSTLFPSTTLSRSRTTTTGIVEYRGASGSIPAYLARPSGDGVWPGVVVIHDLFGLMDHTRDIAERFAYEGYVALRSEEHTSELQSPCNLVCRLLLE